MNVWKLTAAGNLVKSNEEPQPQEDKIRVRVTKVFVNDEDALLFRGKRKVKYPIVPGRYAVGLVADENGGALFPKGARVLLHYYLPAEDSGTAQRDFSEDDFRICGQTADGFLRDFVYIGKDDITRLPDSVNDEKALLIHQLSLAKAAIEALNVHKGEHIAVIGGNVLGIFICRLLIYQQVSPILIDARQDRLDFAKSMGVYYTSRGGSDLMEFLGTITGGRLADGVAFVVCAGGNDVSLPVKVCASGKNIVYCGQSGDGFPLDLNGAIKKKLTICGVPDGTDEIEAAINLLANRAIDVSSFRFLSADAARADALLGALADDPANPVNEINVLNLA